MLPLQSKDFVGGYMRFLKVLCLALFLSLMIVGNTWADDDNSSSIEPVDYNMEPLTVPTFYTPGEDSSAVNRVVIATPPVPHEVTSACTTSFCRVMKSFTSIEKGCWFCPVVDTMFKLTDKLTERTNKNLRELFVGTGHDNTDIETSTGIKGLLWYLLGFYILFTVGKAMISMGGIEPGKFFFTELAMPIGRCLMAVFLIWEWDVIYAYMLTPLLELAIGLGMEIQDTAVSGISHNSFNITTGQKQVFFTTCSPNSAYTGETAAASIGYGERFVLNPLSGSTTGLSTAVGSAMVCFLQTASQNLILWMSIGATFLMDCWGQRWFHILPDWEMLVIGLFLFIFAFILYISFPLKLLDVIFKLMFVTALMPLWICFWVVPQTREFTKNAWNLFLNVLMTLLCLSVILTMVLSMLNQLFKGTGLAQIVATLQADYTGKAMRKIDFSSLGLFYSIAIIFICYNLVGKVDYFANKLAASASLGVSADMAKWMTKGLQVGEHFARSATNATLRVTHAFEAPGLIGRGAWSGTKMVGKGLWRFGGKTASATKRFIMGKPAAASGTSGGGRGGTGGSFDTTRNSNRTNQAQNTNPLNQENILGKKPLGKKPTGSSGTGNKKEMTQEDLKKRLGIDNPGDEVMTESKAKNFLKDLVKDSPEMQSKIEELRKEGKSDSEIAKQIIAEAPSGSTTGSTPAAPSGSNPTTTESTEGAAVSQKPRNPIDDTLSATSQDTSGDSKFKPNIFKSTK